MNRVDLELELVTAKRLARSLWVALHGLAESAKYTHPTDDDMDAMRELALQASEAASRAEKAFFEGDADAAAN